MRFLIAVVAFSLISSCKTTQKSDVLGATEQSRKDTSSVCSATPSSRHTEIFDANYSANIQANEGHIRFREVYKKYFLDAFASIPVGILNHYFLHSNSLIMLSYGRDQAYKANPTQFAEYVMVKDANGRVAAMLKGQANDTGFLQIPQIIINLSDDVYAAFQSNNFVDDDKISDEIRQKLRQDFSILPMAFAVYFSHSVTTLLPANGALVQSSDMNLRQPKIDLAFMMLIEMRREAASNPAIFDADMKAQIVDPSLMTPVTIDVREYTKAEQYQKDYDTFWKSVQSKPDAHPFINSTLANFVESSFCQQGENAKTAEVKSQYEMADAFYKESIEPHAVGGIQDAEKIYFEESTSGLGLASADESFTLQPSKSYKDVTLSTAPMVGTALNARFPILRATIRNTLVAIRNVAVGAIYVTGSAVRGAGRLVLGTGRAIRYGMVNMRAPYVPGQPLRNMGRFAVRSLRVVATGNPNQPVFNGCRFGRCRR